jgi:hypothetical protein
MNAGLRGKPDNVDAGRHERHLLLVFHLRKPAFISGFLQFKP